MAEVGRPTDLTDELVKKIKQYILEGKNLKETARACEIDEQKLYQWNSDNYLKLGDKIEGWKRDRKLMLAEQNLEAIMSLGISDKETIRVVADTSKFVAETLGKDNYSKRSEMTGKDGKDLLPTPLLDNLNKDVPNNDSPKEDNKTDQED